MKIISRMLFLIFAFLSLIVTDRLRGADVILYEHDYRGGRMVELSATDQRDSLGELDKQITDVYIEKDNDAIVVLYESTQYRGKGLVVHYRGPRACGVANFNDWARSVRTQPVDKEIV